MSVNRFEEIISVAGKARENEQIFDMQIAAFNAYIILQRAYKLKGTFNKFLNDYNIAPKTTPMTKEEKDQIASDAIKKAEAIMAADKERFNSRRKRNTHTANLQ